jgi:hypothetical protein
MPGLRIRGHVLLEMDPMMSFRGFQWVYDVTTADEETRARAASFVRRLYDAERVNGHRRVTRRPAPAPREPDVSMRCRRTASDPFPVTTFDNSSASPDSELPDLPRALRAEKGVLMNSLDDRFALPHINRKEAV